MPDIVDELDWLSEQAGRAETPPLFGREDFFRRLRADAADEEFPLRLFVGLGGLSAVAAGIVAFFAVGPWTDLTDPLARGVQTLLEVAS
jgi:hypothetical protein